MPVRRGEIWWIDFGTPKGSEQGGRRPALIIQNDIGNSHSRTTSVAALTRSSKAPFPFQVKVSSSETGLADDSTILLEQVLTISVDRLLKRAGVISQQIMRDVDKALLYSLGLPRADTT
jgi:mRNA interferase MazF